MSEVINCPSCKARAKVPREKIPPSGAWAVCPVCRERFFIPGQELGAILEDKIAVNSDLAAPPPIHRHAGMSVSSAMPSTRAIEVERAPLAAEPPTLNIGRKAVFGLVILSVAALMAAMLFSYGMAAKAEPVVAVPAPKPVRVPQYGFNEVKSDLLYLRRKLAPHSRFNQVINYGGIESRMFKHVQELLDPAACGDIVSLRLNTVAPRDGFSIESQCLKPDDRPMVIDVKFMGGWAVITNHKTRLQLDVPLLSAAQREWDQGQRRYRPPESGAS